MRNYIIKRVAQSVLILFCVMFIIYALIRSLPSSFAETMAMQLAQAPGAKPYEEWLAQLNASYGLDLDIVPGFFTWLSKAVVGNFGDSWKWNVPATQKFTEVIGLSVIMGGISFVLSLVIAVPLGVLAATKQYSRADYVITSVALVGISLPTFFFATLLKLFFSVKLGWFDLYGLVGRDYAQLDSMGQFLDKANHLVLPIVTLVIVSIGGYMRYTRTNMLEVLNADYIRTARAKGLSERTVIYKHAFRNTLIPLVTIIGGSLPGLFSGALITETLFSIPGIGYISYQSMVAGDIPFTMFYLSFMAVLTLAVLTLPVIINTTEEALRQVPDAWREASLALGATRSQTIARVVLPAAVPGMLTGAILGLARAAGETAAIMFTAAVFYTPKMPDSVFSAVMSLPYHMYVLATAGTEIEKTRPLQYGTALILLVLVLGMNLIAIIIRDRMQRKR